MKRALQRGLTPARLRLFLGLLWVALVAPTVVLIVQAQRQIKWESFHQYRTLAEELAQRIDADLQRVVAVEEARAYADYRFLVVAGDPATSNYVQRSPLAAFPVEPDIAGLLGYFQVDAAGAFSTPLVPDDARDPARLGIGAAEWSQRMALRDALLAVLSRHQLVQGHAERERKDARIAASADEEAATSSRTARRMAESNEVPEPYAQGLAPAQQAFDKLNLPAGQLGAQKQNVLGRVQDLKLDDVYKEEKAQSDRLEAKRSKLRQTQAETPARALRKEQSALLESTVQPSFADRDSAGDGIHIFESEVAPFELALLDSGHFVLFRKVWRDGQRTVQGAIVEKAAFVERSLAAPFRESALAPMSTLVVAFQGGVLDVIAGAAGPGYVSSAEELSGSVLHQVRLSAPLNGVQLLWNVERLPAGPGAWIVGWSSVVLFGVLVLGFFALYRLGSRQMMLARRQQDFVSAVSHELRTPLTSIRMYGEMLREGWVAEEAKRGYYDFIHDESERLSRLIANVLQLARMERNELQLKPQPASAQALMDMLRSRIGTQVERAGFEVAYSLDPACAGREMLVDSDVLTQIMINLVDNALKFSVHAQRKRLEIDVRPRGERAVVWNVRDYGPGVARSQMRKIFELFYRPGSELTRDAQGTGIGLALVRQLARAMGGEVEVTNREPGAEFSVILPVRP